MGKKKMKQAHENQGNQQPAGNPGNIKRTAIKQAPGKGSPRSSKHGRNVSIGRK